MDTRSFLVPSAAALSLCVTSGCGPAIAGTWDLDSMTANGETTDVPVVYTGTYDGQPYEVTFSASLTFDNDLTGSFDSIYTYTLGDAEPQTDNSTYALTATKVSGKEYTVQADEEGGLDMSCTIEKKAMTCTSGGEPPTTLLFQKASN